MPSASPARKAAFRILMSIERGQSHSDDLLREKSITALAPPDRNLTTALVLGTLRWQLQLDTQIQPLLTRPNAKLDKEIRIALRMGAFQLQHLTRIPARAVIDESVELAKQAGHRFASGMVNAVLRKLAKLELVVPSAKDAYPVWMVERWAKIYGDEATQRICQHGQKQPTQAIRILSPSAESELIQSGIQLEPSELLTNTRLIITGDVTSTPPFERGHIRFQDEGSQLVAELANTGTKILDCCAAPGGKTLILAERNPQAEILACESSEQRLIALRHRLADHASRIEFRHIDASTLTEKNAFDLILADVPCSGTGTLGRNPEIRHRLQPADQPRQAERQRTILAAALRALQPAGRLIYSTCSLEPEENEQVIAEVLAQNPNVRIRSLAANIETLRRNNILRTTATEKLTHCLSPAGHLHLLPGIFQTDGFFISQLEKIQ